MTEPSDKLEIKDKTVIVTDICSSSEIMESLLRRSKIDRWRNILVKFKKRLAQESQNHNFELYKFTGDGWILLFEPAYNVSLALPFLSKLSSEFEAELDKDIFPHLDSPPAIFGLTFGMDSGPLVEFVMMDRTEYVGRAINLACRLQGAIGDTDILSGYRVMMSYALYRSIKKDSLELFQPELVWRKLKNIIRGADFQCYRLAISEIPFKINKAIYGTKKNSVDVTKELISHIKENHIDIFVANNVLGGDPHPGAVKNFQVTYVVNGKTQKKKIGEGARIQLP